MSAPTAAPRWETRSLLAAVISASVSPQALRAKDRIVAEAGRATRSFHDGALDHPPCLDDTTFCAADRGSGRHYQAKLAHEAGLAVSPPAQLSQQLAHVILVACGVAGIAGREHSRPVIQGCDFQPGVVGQNGDGAAEGREHSLRLDASVLREGPAGLLR